MARHRRKAVKAWKQATKALLKGAVLVVAGPGSGKTTLIKAVVKRLARRASVPLQAIVVLTFTRRAAWELASDTRLEGITATTFHGYAFRELRRKKRDFTLSGHCRR